MFDRFAADIRYQILGMFDYVRGHGDTSPMLEALRVRNYEAFATGYNGNGQAAFYGGLIRTAVTRFEQLQGAPAAPPVQGDVYIVQPGEVLSVIAARFGTTVAAIAAANGIVDPDRVGAGQRLRIPGLTATPEVAPSGGETQQPPPAEQTYTVQPGDILSRIAARLGVPLQAIIDLNGIANPDRIQPGQVLRIPPATQPRGMRAPREAVREYIVVRGDSVRSVAAAHGVTPEALAAANDLPLLPGQLIEVPPPPSRRRR
jgi:putative chitinase